MDKVKAKVTEVNIGKYDVDSITVILNKVKTEICFKKSDDVSKYLGKEIYLVENNGVYTIALVKE
jgi:hypothetical protein